MGTAVVAECASCGGPLTGQRRKWCSTDCSQNAARETRLAAHFNITPADYDKILAAQNGGCGICRKKPTPGKRHAVDHDHQTGFVRGLLCFFCNRRVIGARTAAVLIATAAYVQDPPARRALGKDVVAPGRPAKKRRPRRTRPSTRRTSK